MFPDLFGKPKTSLCSIGQFGGSIEFVGEVLGQDAVAIAASWKYRLALFDVTPFEIEGRSNDQADAFLVRPSVDRNDTTCGPKDQARNKFPISKEQKS